jgi:two-component system cell cycle sensor histidine kinase/response regulator CckA
MGGLLQIDAGSVIAALQLGQAAVVLIVAVTLFSFHRSYHRRYLLHWAWSWTALLLYLATVVVAPRLSFVGGPAHPLRLSLSLLAFVSGYLQIVLLLLGTWAIATGREVPRRWVSLAVGAALVAGVLPPVTVALGGAPTGHGFYRLGLRSLSACVAYLAAAAWMLRPRRRQAGLGRRFMAGALVVYSLDQAAYLYLSLAGTGGMAFALVGPGTLDIVTQAVLGVAVVVWLLEDERERVVRAVDETARRQRAQACVYRISEAVHSVKDLAGLFRSIHASVQDVLPATNFYIALHDRAAGRLSFPYFVDEHDEAPAPRPLGRGLTEYVLRTGKPLRATPEMFRELVDRREVELILTNSVDWLGAPLLSGSEAFGVVVIQSYDPAIRLGPEELEMLVYVSEQVASAIESRRAEDALRESEARLRVIVDQVPAILWTTDGELRVTSVVGAGLTALGRTAGELIGTAAPQLLGQDEAARFHHERALAGASAAYEAELDGRTYATHLEPLRDRGGDVRGTIGLAVDGTEQKQARQEIERQARHFRSLIEHAQDAITVVDAEGVVQYESPSIERILGYRPEKVIGRRLERLLHPDDAPAAGRSLESLFASGARKETREVRARHRDGSWRVLETIASRFADETGRPFVILNSRDITERRAAERALRDSEARLRQVIDLVPHFIFAKDAEGRFVLANRAVAEAYGTTVEELLGKTDADFNPSAEEVEHFRNDDLEVIRGGRAKVVSEESITDAAGNVRYLQTVKIPFAFAGSGRRAVLGVSLDITERKATEEALRRAAKEESLAVLAGGVAHDFNNLLAAILGHSSLAMAKLPADSPARRHVEKASLTVERAAALTRQMLAYSGRGHFRIEPTDLNALVRDNLPLFDVALPKSVRIETDLGTTVPLIDADVGQLQQVVMNLVLNAGEAIGSSGGSVTIVTGIREVGPGDDRLWRVSGRPLEPGSYALLEVRDDGPGMDGQTLERVFDPFFSTKLPGRGLGLPAVLGVVRGHRGGLSVESVPGKGTLFRLLFAASRRSPAEPQPLSEEPRLKRIRVLVIDDEDVVREMVREVLEHAGFEVVLAEDGSRGLELLRARPDGIDLILLDLSMPGWSGEETFERLRAVRPDVRVVLSSGYDHAEARGRFADPGPAGFIQKPYRPDELLAEIQRCLGVQAA